MQPFCSMYSNTILFASSAVAAPSLIGDVQRVQMFPEHGAGLVLFIKQLWYLVQLSAYVDKPRLYARCPGFDALQ